MVDVARAAERGVQRSSRRSASGAGWGTCQTPGSFAGLRPDRRRFSWLRPVTLWRSRNEVLAGWFGDPAPVIRRAWVAALRERGRDPRTPISLDLGDSFSFLVIGDPGEGDASQYAVVPGLLRMGEGTAFAVVASDVIYPAGGGNDYPDKFFRPYRDYPGPIYAVPGNHDWYDGLHGFMRVFCDAPALPRERARPAGLLARLLWRRPERVDEVALAAARGWRAAPAQQARQPGSYWVLDTGPLLIVGIDTGIGGSLDADQGEWLRSVSRDPRPKMLITGSPIYERNHYKPCPIEGGGTVDEIVREPGHNYVAVIGGEIHNYQRYPVDVGGRRIQYLVAGGGGAFMHATHTIPRVTAGGVDEDDFRCYPLRGDSLAFYSRLYRRLFRAPWLEIAPEKAMKIMSDRIGNRPVRPLTGEERVTRRERWAARLLGGLPFPGRLPVERFVGGWISELFDWDEPPFFKSFLHVQVTPDTLALRCFAATGCGEHEADPPLEDEVLIPLTRPPVTTP
ncbi:metallophosphoesterase family protein [Rhizohabitans arisaemae]|uniref:metallophosphoesterase family protein n=1 Tax=Rhizohabitans arisaemae TaxID=2720610 RepID=UPI0024B1A27E|nr:metallophosphoesterase [Rhizohabitans arisaemae]